MQNVVLKIFLLCKLALEKTDKLLKYVSVKAWSESQLQLMQSFLLKAINLVFNRKSFSFQDSESTCSRATEYYHSRRGEHTHPSYQSNRVQPGFMNWGSLSVWEPWDLYGGRPTSSLWAFRRIQSRFLGYHLCRLGPILGAHGSHSKC